jgi:hypothetical protein
MVNAKVKVDIVLGLKMLKIVYARFQESVTKIGDVNKPVISKLLALKLTVTPPQEGSIGH